MQNRVIYRAFGNAEAYIDDMYGVFRSLYDLPTFVQHDELEDRALFEYCKARKYFLLILPYTTRGEVLLSPAFNGERLTWRIVGGGLNASFEDDFVSASQRHISRYVPDVLLGEIEPIAFLRNTFSFDAERHEHLGIAFIARIRNAADQAIVDQLPTSRGHFVSINDRVPSLNQTYQKDILGNAIAKIRSALTFSTQENEIGTNEQYRGRYVFHDVFVKPLMRFFSRLGYPFSIAQLDERIRQMVLASGTTSILDVACGENFSIVNFSISDRVPLVVGNDISWSQIELLGGTLNSQRFRNSESFVLFTNHDARRLPFKDKSFDCVICKNVLHHMPDQNSVTRLISELRRVGKRSLIVEVMDPKFESVWGRIRHQYYMRFLKDAGGNFLSRQEFDQLTDNSDRHEKFEMATIRGVYQFAAFN